METFRWIYRDHFVYVPSPIGWAHAQNDPWTSKKNPNILYSRKPISSLIRPQCVNSISHMISTFRHHIIVTSHKSHGVSNHRQREYLFNSLSRVITQKTSKRRTTSPLRRKSNGVSSKRADNPEIVSIPPRHPDTGPSKTSLSLWPEDGAPFYHVMACLLQTDELFLSVDQMVSGTAIATCSQTAMSHRGHTDTLETRPQFPKELCTGLWTQSGAKESLTPSVCRGPEIWNPLIALFRTKMSDRSSEQDRLS